MSCADDPQDPQRGSVAKADIFGSCEESDCNGPSDSGTCWCDELCVDYGDCCADKAEVCDGVSACVDAGGQCLLHSPEGCGANAQPADLGCEIASDLCCVPTPVPTSCEDAGGTVHPALAGHVR